MLVRHHIEITRQAIGAEVGPRALKSILRANCAQDGLRYQLGHDHFHFDSNQFKESYAYIEEQRALVRARLERGDAESAWQAFGRMIHAVQDFYSHSDYIPRWLSRFNGATPPAPEEVDPVSSDILQHPDLHSGKLYYPLEALAFIPFLKKTVLPLLPADSHAHMNLDKSDGTGRFDYIMQASIKRTRLEFDNTIAKLSSTLQLLFTDH
jgi:hypothetical protein